MIFHSSVTKRFCVKSGKSFRERRIGMYSLCLKTRGDTNANLTEEATVVVGGTKLIEFFISSDETSFSTQGWQERAF